MLCCSNPPWPVVHFQGCTCLAKALCQTPAFSEMSATRSISGRMICSCFQTWFLLPRANFHLQLLPKPKEQTPGRLPVEAPTYREWTLFSSHRSRRAFLNEIGGGDTAWSRSQSGFFWQSLQNMSHCNSFSVSGRLEGGSWYTSNQTTDFRYPNHPDRRR